MDFKSSGFHMFGNADVKEECVLNDSNHILNEGNVALYLHFVIFCITQM